MVGKPILNWDWLLLDTLAESLSHISVSIGKVIMKYEYRTHTLMFPWSGNLINTAIQTTGANSFYFETR